MIARNPALTAMSAGLLVVAVGHAAPVPGPGLEHLVKGDRPGTPASPVMPRSTGFFENFDTYTAGSGVVGQNGWQLWSSEYLDGLVVNTTAASPPNSLEAVNFGGTNVTDIVQVFDITSGKWEVKVKTFVPTGMVGESFFIMLNTFSAPYVSDGNWSLQLRFHASTGLLTSNNAQNTSGPIANVTTPLIYDQWVELRAEIDLDHQPNGRLNVWYGETHLLIDHSWYPHVSLPSPTAAVRIQCIDLFTQSTPGPNGNFKWDDISLTELPSGCYANCDNSTVVPILNVDDFTCFINEFAAAQALSHQQQLDHYANCDGSTIAPVLNVDDFTCFINAFAQGCQ